MSYEIMYQTRFVRYGNKLITVTEQGSNNCWESDRKRVRSWWFWSPAGKIATGEEVLKSIENIREKELAREKSDWDEKGYSDESWSFYTALHVYGKRHTTYREFYNFFKSAVRNAKTIEEWKELGVTFYTTLRYEAEKRLTPEEVKHLDNKRIESSEQLAEYIDHEEVYLNSYGEVRRPQRGWSTVAIEQDHYYIVLTPEGLFFDKFLPHGYRYYYQKENGKRFKTESHAKRVAGKREGFTVERVNEPTKFYKRVYHEPKPLV
jgi:hypothetical protein